MGAIIKPGGFSIKVLHVIIILVSVGYECRSSKTIPSCRPLLIPGNSISDGSEIGWTGGVNDEIKTCLLFTSQ